MTFELEKCSFFMSYITYLFDLIIAMFFLRKFKALENTDCQVNVIESDRREKGNQTTQNLAFGVTFYSHTIQCTVLSFSMLLKLNGPACRAKGNYRTLGYNDFDFF